MSQQLPFGQGSIPCSHPVYIFHFTQKYRTMYQLAISIKQLGEIRPRPDEQIYITTRYNGENNQKCHGNRRSSLSHKMQYFDNISPNLFLSIDYDL